MKKIIFSLIAIIAFGLLAQAQVLPRYGTRPNQDNTGRVFTYGYTTLAGTALTVTGTNLNYNMSLIFITTSTGNTTISGRSLTTGKIGDIVRVVIGTCTSTNVYTFQNSPTSASTFGFNYTGTLSVPGLKNANINFINNGNNRYVEMSRFIEP